MKLALTMIISYLIGCFSSAYIIGKFVKNIDIREHGSGNSGATNALRVMGIKVAVMTFLLDVLKGVISAIIGYKLAGTTGQLLGGLCAVIGHNWPVFLNFKGGKGVATSLGVLLTISWKVSLIGVLIGLIVALVSKYVSLGSLSFLLSFPIIYILLEDFNKNKFAFSILLFLLSAYRHRENINRLLSGTENKISVGR